MTDPFFEYLKRERMTLSQRLYGFEPPRYKEYVRYPRTALPTPERITTPLSTLLEERRSTREFSDEPLSLGALATVLYWSVGRIQSGGRESRPHPSGGAKYPIEPYVLARDVAGLAEGAYHYNVKEHALEELARAEIGDMSAKAFDYPFVGDAHAVICLTFIKARSLIKYGGLAYKIGLIEAGHVGQNVYTAAGALSIGCCGLAGGETKEMYDLLGIDGGNEHLVYSIMLGNRKK